MAELSRGQILKDPEILGTSTSGAKIRLQDGDESAYIDLKSPDTVTTSYTLTLPADDGTANQVLQTDGSGTTSWTTVTASPAGSDTQLQYNNSGSFAGATNLTTDGNNLTIGAQGDIRLADSDSSNYVAFQAPATVAADRLYTLPDTIGTAGQVLKISTRTDTTATLAWQDDNTGGAGSSPGGSDTYVQFNDSGVFGGDVDFTWDKTDKYLNISGYIGLGAAANSNFSKLSIECDLANDISGIRVIDPLELPELNIYNNEISVLSGNLLLSATATSGGNIILTPNQISGGTIFLDTASPGSVEAFGSVVVNAGNDGGNLTLNNGCDIIFKDADNSNSVTFAVPASVTSNYTITLPAAGGAANEILQFDGSQTASFVSNTRTLNFVIDGGGSAITTGVKGHIVLDGDYTVTGWTVIADQSGSIVVDVNRATYTNFPTTASIAGTELPTLSSAQKAEDLTLSSWTTTLSARDVLEFEVDSATTVTRVTVALRLVPR